MEPADSVSALVAVQSDWGRRAEFSTSPGGAVVFCMVGWLGAVPPEKLAEEGFLSCSSSPLMCGRWGASEWSR